MVGGGTAVGVGPGVEVEEVLDGLLVSAEDGGVELREAGGGLGETVVWWEEEGEVMVGAAEGVEGF